MADLFLDPKVLNYSGDKYQLILLTLQWAKTLKAKGSPEPLGTLIEKALKDIVENRITKEEIIANKVALPPVEEAPSAMSVAEEGPGKELKLPLPPDDSDDEEEKKKSKKKKKSE